MNGTFRFVEKLFRLWWLQNFFKNEEFVEHAFYFRNYACHAGYFLSFSAGRVGCRSKCQNIQTPQNASQRERNTLKLFLKLATGQIDTLLTFLWVYCSIIDLRGASDRMWMMTKNQGIQRVQKSSFLTKISDININSRPG